MGLSFRVRNGTGRLSWAMAAANLLLYGQTLGSAGLWRPGNRIGDAIAVDVSSCVHPVLIAIRDGLQEDDAVPERIGECECCLSSVSTGRLHPSRGFHVRPIDHVFCMGTTGTRRFHGMLILEQASRLDAFSGYPSRTWPTSRAAGATTGIPEVRPPRSSRTMGRPPQDSNERRG